MSIIGQRHHIVAKRGDHATKATGGHNFKYIKICGAVIAC
jgi:hypothetical protein